MARRKTAQEQRDYAIGLIQGAVATLLGIGMAADEIAQLVKNIVWEQEREER